MGPSCQGTFNRSHKISLKKKKSYISSILIGLLQLLLNMETEWDSSSLTLFHLLFTTTHTAPQFHWFWFHAGLTIQITSSHDDFSPIHPDPCTLGLASITKEENDAGIPMNSWF